MFRTGWSRLTIVLLFLWEAFLIGCVIVAQKALSEIEQGKGYGRIEDMQLSRTVSLWALAISPVIVAAFFFSTKWIVGGFRGPRA